MSGEVENWLPGEPGKYVTILDLKERWMKKKQQEEEEERKRKKKKKKEAETETEREVEEKVCERLDEFKIGGEEDRVVAKRLGANRWKSGRGGKRGMSDLKAVADGDVDVEVREMPAGSNSQFDGRWHGVGDGHLLRVLKSEKSEYKKVGDVKVNGDDVVGNDKSEFASSGGGRYRSGKRFSGNRSCVKGRVLDHTENVDVDDDKGGREQNEEVGSVSDEKASGMNCPCHSRIENQCGGGFWVCKYVEPAPRAIIAESVKGNEVLEGEMNGRMEEVKLQKKHRLPRKEREGMTVEWEKEDAIQVNGDFLRIINHDAVPKKAWQPREKWEMGKGVKDEVAVAGDKGSQRVINRDVSSQKNDVKLQPKTAEPSVEIEEHSKASAVAERETNRRGNFRARGNPVGGRKINDAERFKAKRNSGSLTMDYVTKEDMHVNGSRKKTIDQAGNHHKNDEWTSKLENMEPMDCPEKSEAALGTEMVENSRDKFRYMRNKIYLGKKVVNGRLQTDRTLANERTTNTKYFNGRMREMGKGGLVWVKKGEVPVDNAGSKD